MKMYARKSFTKRVSSINFPEVSLTRIVTLTKFTLIGLKELPFFPKHLILSSLRKKV